MPETGQRIDHLPRKQVVLPFHKSFEIAVKSIRVRFFRSLITTMSLILAISFFAYVKFNSNVAQKVFMADDQQAIRKLIHLGYDPVNYENGQSVSPKERWILFLSLMVCVVGIVNTQLMAVTERFRDIGTMKCLGALDRFILRLFLIEAGLQGIIGASIGAVCGILIAFFNTFIRFGPSAWTFICLTDVVRVFLAVGIGCALSIAGVMYPAMTAARMQPVQAMKGRD